MMKNYLVFLRDFGKYILSVFGLEMVYLGSALCLSMKMVLCSRVLRFKHVAKFFGKWYRFCENLVFWLGFGLEMKT
jgi:hypothetical protein